MRLALALIAVSAFAQVGTMTIRETTGSTQTSRPITFGRPFKQGDIASYPSPRVNGIAPSLWQTDVKNRWGDGSVKFAIISFHATLPASTTVAVDFENSSNACHLGNEATCQAAALDGAGMLALRSGNWTASIEITNGTTQTASARTMISNGHFSYWLRGPVVTQMVCRDISGRTYEMGFASSTLGISPQFIITGYPNYTAGIREEFILENGWTDRIIDQTYSLAMKNGTGGATTVYSRASFTHYAMGRIHKGNEGTQIWDGTAPGAVEINHNVTYLKQTKALPNYDDAVSVSAGTVSTLLSTWTSFSAAKDLGTFKAGGSGNQNTNVLMAMGTTGGRADIGFVYEHEMQMLYAGSASLDPYMFDLADAAGYPPLHIREHRTDNYYCAYGCTGGNATTLAQGKPVWVEARRTVFNTPSQWTSSGTVTADKITAVGAITTGSWSIDTAHHPSLAYIPYLISGSFYAYEELLFWANWVVSAANPNAAGYGRNYEYGLIAGQGFGQQRGQAWALRTVGQAAFVAVDGTPEAQSYQYVLRKTAEAWEGTANITAGNYPPTDSSCPGNTPGGTGPSSGANRNAWCWGRYIVESNKSNPTYTPPTYVTGYGCQKQSGEGWGAYDCSVVGDTLGNTWQFGYWLLAAGWVNEAVNANSFQYVLDAYADFYIDSYKIASPLQYPVTGGTYGYHIYMKDVAGNYFSTLAAYKAGFIKTGATTTTSSMTASSTSFTVADYTQLSWKPMWARVAADVSSISVTSGTIRVTLVNPHGLAVGDRILTGGHATTALNTNSGTGSVTAVRYITATPSANSFEYAYVGASAPADGAYAVTGTFVVRTPRINILLRIENEVVEVCKIDTDGSVTIGTNGGFESTTATPCTAGALYRGRAGTTAASHSSGVAVGPAYDAWPGVGQSGTHQYPWIMRSGISYLRDYSSSNGTGAELWTWLQTNMWTPFKSTYLASESPQWDVWPRSDPPFSITTSGVPAGTSGTAYSTTLASTGGTGSVTWAVDSGTLPAGLSLDAGTGVISGTPSGAIATNVTFSATDSAAQVRRVTLGMGVTAGSGITVSPLSLPSGTVGTAYSQTLTASGGTPTYSWSLQNGPLPNGISLAGGVLSGTPTQGGTFPITVRVTDSLGVNKDQDYSFVVAWLTLTITTSAALPDGNIDIPYSQTIAATGGDSVYTWTLVGGVFPAGLSLNASTGAITGIPNTAGNYSFTLRVSSGDGQTNDKTFTLIVTPPSTDVSFKGTRTRGMAIRCCGRAGSTTAKTWDTITTTWAGTTTSWSGT